jgi:hypothetical protein
MSTEWGEYAELARRLDAVRNADRAHTEGRAEAVAQLGQQADALQARLADQAEALTRLAGTLRLRPPDLSPVPPDGAVDAATGLSAADAAADSAGIEGRRADQRGQSAALLPGWSERARSLLVYAVAALLILLAQWFAFLRTGTGTSPLLVLVLIPMACLLAGYLVLRAGGRARVAGEPPVRHTKLGVLLCFGIGPIAILALIVRSFAAR